MTGPSSIVIGRIAGAFGVRGELKCDPTSAGRALFVAGAQLRSDRDGESATITIEAVRAHRGRLLVRLAGVDGAEAAAKYAGALLYAARDAITLAPGEYLDDDLAGCVVVGLDGTEYGSVERVAHYPSSDMLVVAGRMVPMVRAIVVAVDLSNRRIEIDPPAELLD